MTVARISVVACFEAPLRGAPQHEGGWWMPSQTLLILRCSGLSLSKGRASKDAKQSCESDKDV
jgi:hypothetical protein